MYLVNYFLTYITPKSTREVIFSRASLYKIVFQNPIRLNIEVVRHNISFNIQSYFSRMRRCPLRGSRVTKLHLHPSQEHIHVGKNEFYV